MGDKVILLTDSWLQEPVVDELALELDELELDELELVDAEIDVDTSVPSLPHAVNASKGSNSKIIFFMVSP